MTADPLYEGGFRCIDSNCKSERTTLCVFRAMQNAPERCVPFLSCLDAGDAGFEGCAAKAGIAESAYRDAVTPCVKDTTVSDPLMEQAFHHWSETGLSGVPVVLVDGALVDHKASAVADALCANEPSLKGCSNRNDDSMDTTVSAVVQV